MEQVYLSRRNLETLLAKLDAKKAGHQTAVTIVKNDTQHEEFPCSVPCWVTGVEDEEYYTDREPGEVAETSRYPEWLTGNGGSFGEDWLTGKDDSKEAPSANEGDEVSSKYWSWGDAGTGFSIVAYKVVEGETP